MKNVTLLLVILLAVGSTGTTNAQKFYLKGGFGYTFPLASQTADVHGSIYHGSTTNHIEYELKNASFSAGGSALAAFGYMSGCSLGFEIGLHQSIFPRHLIFKDGMATGSATNVYHAEIDQRAGMLYITPSVALQSSGNKTKFYARLGPALPLHTSIKMRYTYHSPIGTINDIDAVWRIKTTFSVGAAAAFGVQHQVSSSLSIFCEAAILSMSQYMEEKRMESYSKNGVEYNSVQLQQFPVEKYTRNLPSGNGSNSPFLTYSLPFSNVGIYAGVKFTLHEHNHAPADKRESK